MYLMAVSYQVLQKRPTLNKLLFLVHMVPRTLQWLLCNIYYHTPPPHKVGAYQLLPFSPLANFLHSEWAFVFSTSCAKRKSAHIIYIRVRTRAREHLTDIAHNVCFFRVLYSCTLEYYAQVPLSTMLKCHCVLCSSAIEYYTHVPLSTILMCH